MAKTTIDYDKENDSLYLFRQGNVQGSMDIGDFIIDLSKDDKVLGLEILNASKNLNLSKKILSMMLSAKLKSEYRNDVAIISALLIFESREIPIKIPIPISA